MFSVPENRLCCLNQASVNPHGNFVLYWMSAFRRAHWNFALQHAAHRAQELKKPLLILETLNAGIHSNNDRLHHFALDGLRANTADFAKSPVRYYPVLLPNASDSTRLIKTLAEHACVVVTDDFPLREWAADLRCAAQISPVLLEAVDSNGLLPINTIDRVFSTAYSFRRFLQQELPQHLTAFPLPNPLRNLHLPQLRSLPKNFRSRGPAASDQLLAGDTTALAKLPIDHTVQPVKIRGGRLAAQRTLRRFLKDRLPRYIAERNEPEKEATSGLSPYLHWGHISPHQIFAELMKHENWNLRRLSSRATGKKTGWWGAGEPAEAFLDQLVCWRELGYNFCRLRDDYDAFESLPDWATQTLAKHSKDIRQYIYSPEDLERAQTHDPLWNAAQIQLVREGRLHNYLRMLWGKKILEWSPSPQEALHTMIHLNNTYALDGRNPNSYSGIFWCLGRYDHPWGPERPVFGTVRYMSSENTARKVRVKDFVRKYST